MLSIVPTYSDPDHALSNEAVPGPVAPGTTLPNPSVPSPVTPGATLPNPSVPHLTPAVTSRHRFRWFADRLRSREVDSEAGAATAEYVIATMAAVGFAGLLVVIMRGDEMRGILTDLVRNALTLVS